MTKRDDLYFPVTNLMEIISTIPEEHLRYTEAREFYGEGLVRTAIRRFGSWRRAVIVSGRVYPKSGTYRYRSRVYLKNPQLFEAELDAGLIPREKLKNTWDFCDVAEIERPVSKYRKSLCRLCGKNPVLYRHHYCEECRREPSWKTHASGTDVGSPNSPMIISIRI